MQPRPTIIWTIAVSVIFVIAIVLCDRLTAGTQWNQTVTDWLIALWFIPFGILIGTCRTNEGHLSAGDE